MYHDQITAMAKAARGKEQYLRRSPLAYTVSAMLAGAYVGVGVMLILSVGAPLAAEGSAWLKLVMGASFGVALTLVVFAGSELFTGNNMIMTLGVLQRRVGPGALARVWSVCWVGNLLGGMLLAGLVVGSGALEGAMPLAQQIAADKMAAPATQLLLRGVLCNWLVCLALWTSGRAQGDAARCILIFWCLFAFIACGFEHSVANMSLLTMALLAEHGPAVSWGGFAHNMLWVTVGNVLGGAVFVAGAYWLASHKHREPEGTLTRGEIAEPAPASAE